MDKRISNIEVMGDHLLVSFFKILCPEKKSLCKNVHVMLESFSSKWMVRVTVSSVGLHLLTLSRRLPA